MTLTYAKHLDYLLTSTTVSSRNIVDDTLIITWTNFEGAEARLTRKILRILIWFEADIVQGCTGALINVIENTISIAICKLKCEFDANALHRAAQHPPVPTHPCRKARSCP
jgi:hypothetical protein